MATTKAYTLVLDPLEYNIDGDELVVLTLEQSEVSLLVDTEDPTITVEYTEVTLELD